MNQFEQLKQWTTLVADTGDIEAIRVHTPQDATTNPSLILQAATMPQYRPLIERAVRDSNETGTDILDRLSVAFGTEILAIVPGRVSVEVDPRLSFDVENTVAKARRLIELFEAAGVGRERVLIKIAATWEGIRAAEVLENEGIHCNLTLIFSLIQAVACGQAGVTLISPFVGRILDWYLAKEGVESIPAERDPGVYSVAQIYNYFKRWDIGTQVMGASFRNVGEIRELAGCDLLTIAPTLLDQLKASSETIVRKLNPDTAKSSDLERIEITENSFRWWLNEDAMATEKLAEGIRGFTKAICELEQFVARENLKVS